MKKESMKQHEKDDYIYNHHFSVQEKLIWHCKSTILQLKKKKPVLGERSKVSLSF